MIKLHKDFPRCFGRFKFDLDFVRSDPECAARVMSSSNFLVLRAECLFAEDNIVYTAWSRLFDDSPEGEVIPEYQIIVKNEGDQMTVSMSRVDSSPTAMRDSPCPR